MEQRVYRGDIDPEQLADYLVMQFDPQPDLQAQRVGQGRSLLDGLADWRECPHLGNRIYQGRTWSRPMRPCVAAGPADTALAAAATLRWGRWGV